MLPTSVNTNVQTIESFVSDLVGPHTYVHLYARYARLECLLRTIESFVSDLVGPRNKKA